MTSRRVFLKSGGLALFAAGLGGVPSFIARAAQSNKLWVPYKKNKILVCIFQMHSLMDANQTVRQDRSMVYLRIWQQT